MLICTARLDDHVVEVCETDARYQSAKYDRHESLVNGRRIAQAERHLNHLEEAGVCNKHRFHDVGKSDWHLMIRHRKVKKNKHAAVKCFREAKQWKAVKLGGCIYSMIVHAHAPGAIFFFTITMTKAHGDVEGRAT